MPMINRTCGTAIEGARFITLLISGNNISTVEANSPCIICSDKVEMCKYTSQKGIYYPLSGYNMDKTVEIGLEIEITSEDMWEVFEINKEGKESFFSISADIEAINKVVNSFYE